MNSIKKHGSLVLEGATITFPFSFQRVIGSLLGIHIDTTKEILTKKGILYSLLACSQKFELLDPYYEV